MPGSQCRHFKTWFILPLSTKKNSIVTSNIRMYLSSFASLNFSRFTWNCISFEVIHFVPKSSVVFYILGGRKGSHNCLCIPFVIFLLGSFFSSYLCAFVVTLFLVSLFAFSFTFGFWGSFYLLMFINFTVQILVLEIK